MQRLKRFILVSASVQNIVPAIYTRSFIGFFWNFANFLPIIWYEPNLGFFILAFLTELRPFRTVNAHPQKSVSITPPTSYIRLLLNFAVLQNLMWRCATDSIRLYWKCNVPFGLRISIRKTFVCSSYIFHPQILLPMMWRYVPVFEISIRLF